ncbi:MAG: asparaginase domain-containing protein [archaeon]|nr:asparaginase domain-containing protein [archaeon]
MSEKTIHFVITGGTIDSYYEGIKDTAVPNEKSIIPRFVKSLKLYSPVEFTEICMKDSRDIVKEDLKNILNAVEKSPHKKIIITHGTYTMPDTARFLKANLKRKDQTIIITGSMIPLLGFSPSDGPFAIGYALAKVQDLKNRIYVCMNGRVFSSEEVMKVNKEGRFTSLFGENE